MSKDEIKSEINQVLDHLFNDALAELLNFLKQLDKRNTTTKINSGELNRILFEDRELLEKLAQ
jgi:hypothetical protein